VELHLAGYLDYLGTIVLTSQATDNKVVVRLESQGEEEGPWRQR